jgi:hypothetical protein
MASFRRMGRAQLSIFSKEDMSNAVFRQLTSLNEQVVANFNSPDAGVSNVYISETEEYVRTIVNFRYGHGPADCTHFRIDIPKCCKDKISKEDAKAWFLQWKCCPEENIKVL